MRILEAYVPMKIQEAWASQFQQNKAGVGSQRMRRLGAGQALHMRGTGWPDAAKRCWVCPGTESVPHGNGLEHCRRTAQPHTTTCSSWRASQRGSSSATKETRLPPAAVVPQKRESASLWMVRFWGEPSKDGHVEEVTMADTVPLNLRVDIRQEILTMGSEDEAMKVRERQQVKVLQRSLQEAEQQSFKLYHPQVERAIRKKEEFHKALSKRELGGDLGPEAA